MRRLGPKQPSFAKRGVWRGAVTGKRNKRSLMRFGGSGASNMSRKKITLSVIIIAKNEEARIGKCLDALEFADERIVVDNSSSDRTSQVATEHDAIVQFAHSTDFALLRNNAASKVRG